MNRVVFATLFFTLYTIDALAVPPSKGNGQSHAIGLDSGGFKLTIANLQQWSQRRDTILEQVQKVMGEFPRPERAVPLNVEILSSFEDEKILRKKVAYSTEAHSSRVHAWLLFPRYLVSDGSRRTRLPAVLCLHQTTDVGKDEPAGLAGDHSLAYARELAERGFITLAPDYPSFGEYDYDFANDEYKSGSMKAIYDNVRAVDFLTTLAEVDAERIGVIGHSLGGHNSIFSALFEPRLKVVVTSCAFTRFEKYYGGDLAGWTSPRYMPRIRSWYHCNPEEVPFDFTDLIASLAPRPFLAIAPLHDHNFEVSGVQDVMSAARPIYHLFNANDKLQASYPDCKHEFPSASRKLAYHFIAQHLNHIIENQQ